MATTGPTHTKTCISCGTQLVLNHNWWSSFKGKKHYKCMNCYAVRRRENYLKRRAEQLGEKVIKQYNQIKQGYVYVVSNPAWPEWVKIGMAVDAEDRCRSYQTSSPFRDFNVEFALQCDDRAELESKVHQQLVRDGYERRGEWFKVQPFVAGSCIQYVYGDEDSE